MSKDFTLCTRCSANNMPGRSTCWQCGTKLPLAIGLDGRHIAVETTTREIGPADIEALLAQASTVDVESDTKKFLRDQREMAEKALRGASGETSTGTLSLKGRLRRLLHRAPQSQP